MFWIICGLLIAVSFGFILFPLVRNSAADQLDRAMSSAAIFKDQLAEIERDLARGVISQTETKAAKIEVQRRLIAAQKTGEVPSAHKHGGRITLIASAVFIPVLGALIYAQIGQPNLPSQPYASRQGELAELREVSDLTDKLKERLTSDAHGGPSEGWMLLGQTYLRMGRYGDAADAFGRLLGRTDATAPVFTLYAEALIAGENGQVLKPAEQAIDRALELDASLPAAVYYKALVVEQAGDVGRAHDMLLARLASVSEPGEWIDSFVGRANQLAESLGRAPVS